MSEQLVQDTRPHRRGSGRSRAPLAIASFIAIPLFFSSLMASALAVEKPRTSSGGAADTPQRRTARRVPDDDLPRPDLGHRSAGLALGAGACRPADRRGLDCDPTAVRLLLACLAAIVDAMAVVHKTATWEQHHTQRFPNGVDLIAANNPASNQFDPGQWERMARDTSLSLEHWTIALALISLLVVLGLAVKRRYFGRRPAPVFGAIDAIGAPSASPPEISDTAPFAYAEVRPHPRRWIRPRRGIFLRPLNLCADPPSERREHHLRKGSDAAPKHVHARLDHRHRGDSRRMDRSHACRGRGPGPRCPRQSRGTRWSRSRGTDGASTASARC